MKITDWQGYQRIEFEVNGKEGFIVLPKDDTDTDDAEGTESPEGVNKAKGRPWIWRAEFFDAFDQADQALLEQGYCRAYYRQNDRYGCPDAVAGMRDFHAFVTQTFGLAEKAVLFGFSRGGLYAFNYAATYPENVAALYLDAPVLDIRSWPGGKGSGQYAPQQWQECLAAYGLTEEESEHARVSPLQRLEAVAQARIPILLVAGDADSVVPYGENGAILASRYPALGAPIEVIVKPGVEHHPHSLEDPAPIVSFVRGLPSLLRS